MLTTCEKQNCHEKIKVLGHGDTISLREDDRTIFFCSEQHKLAYLDEKEKGNEEVAGHPV